MFSLTHIQHRLLTRLMRRSGLRQRSISLPNGKIHTWEGGEGPPILLLHGFGATAIWQWFAQIRRFARNHRVIMPDLLFFGESTSSRPERSLAFQAETVFQLLDELQVERTHVVSLSYGGFVAGVMALSQPERINKLVVTGSPLHLFGTKELNELLERFDVSSLHELMIPDNPKQLRRLIGLAWHRPPRIPSFLLPDIYRTLYTNQVEEKRGLLDATLEHLGSTHKAVRGFPQETLLVWGEHDQVFPVQLGQRLREVLPGEVKFQVIPDTAHTPNMEKPSIYNDLVLQFLQS